jgi:hypothetical protein
MSIFEKHRGNKSYVYFQAYEDDKRTAVYVGSSDSLATWKKAERLFLEYIDRRLEERFYSKVPAVFRNEIKPKRKL